MKSGIITESSELYHAETEHISSTPLRKMELSPAHFFAAWKGKQEESTPAQKRGTFFHDLLLEQNVSHYVPRPLKADGSLMPTSMNDYKAWLATIGDKTPIHPDDFNEMNAALDAYCENKAAMKMIDGAEIEKSVYAVDHETGIKVKARPDIWGKGRGYIVDLKSCGAIDKYFIKSIFSNGYDIQLEHYRDVIFQATGERINDCYILAFETEAPYASKIFKLSRAALESAKQIRRQYLNEIKACMDDGIFPAYSQEITEVDRPEYLDDKLVTSFEGVG